jgi:CD63 antigen
MVVPIFMLSLGGLTFGLSIFGFFGGLKRNPCLTTTYAIILSILVVCEISAGITGFVKQDQVSAALIKISKDSMPRWQEPAVRKVWDTIQVNHQSF